jgi:hypothetical protein
MQTSHDLSTVRRRYRGWITRGVVGIVLATFFSDVGHEMATATLPLYLGSIGLGAAALGLIEGLADLLFSLSKLAGGWVGHHTERKRTPRIARLSHDSAGHGRDGDHLHTRGLGVGPRRGMDWAGVSVPIARLHACG